MCLYKNYVRITWSRNDKTLVGEYYGTHTIQCWRSLCVSDSMHGVTVTKSAISAEKMCIEQFSDPDSVRHCQLPDYMQLLQVSTLLKMIVRMT